MAINQGPTGGLGSNYSQTSGYVNTNAGPATSYSGSPQSSGYSARTGSYGGSVGYAGNASGPRNTGQPATGNYGGSNNSGIGGYGGLGSRSGYDPGIGGVPGGIIGRGNAPLGGLPPHVDANWFWRNRNASMDPGVFSTPRGIPGRGTERWDFPGFQRARREASQALPSQRLGPNWSSARTLLGNDSERFGMPSQNVSQFTGFQNPFKNSPFR